MKQYQVTASTVRPMPTMHVKIDIELMPHEQTSYCDAAVASNHVLERAGAWWRYASDGIPQCHACGYHLMLAGDWADWPDNYQAHGHCPKCGYYEKTPA